MNAAAKFLSVCILLIVIYFTLFWQLEKKPIQLWDESRNVQNAVEMYESGNYLVTYYELKPEMWNTKPPLLIVMQVFCIKIFGLRELAFRLPSAIAGMLTAFLLFLWYYKREDNVYKGFVAGIILLTTVGYVHLHCTRTGDYDALLIFWVISALLSFYHYVDVGKKKYLYISAVFMSLGALTKGVHAFLVMPIMYSFWLLKGRNFKILLKDGTIYFLIAIAPLIIYYIARDSVNPGYMQAVMDNEWGGRYLSTLEDHKFPWYFYLQHHFNTGTKFWFPFTIISLIVYLYLSSRKKNLFFATYILMLIVGYHVIIALSQTKLDWYGNTLYPLYGLFIVEALFAALDKKYALFIIGMVAIFPLFLVLKNNYDFPNPYEDDSCHTAKILQLELKNNTLSDTTKVIAYGYVPHVKYYAYVAGKRGKYVPLVAENTIRTGDIVITHRKASMDIISTQYDIQELRGYKTAKKFLVLKKKTKI